MKDEKTKRHSRIKFQQRLELLFIFYWVLCIIFWIIKYIKIRDAKESCFDNPFQREIQNNDSNATYLQTRKRYAWVKYINRELDYKERIKRANRKKNQTFDKDK